MGQESKIKKDEMNMEDQMIKKVFKIGKSYAITLPRKMCEENSIGIGDFVKVEVTLMKIVPNKIQNNGVAI